MSEIIKLTTAEDKKGTDEPNSSHNNPAVNEPTIIAIPDSIVSNPIAVPRHSSRIKSDIHAFDIPSVDAE